MTERPVVLPPEHADRPAGEPFLRVVRGHPTPAEIAALVAALVVRDRDTGAAARPVRPPRSAWGDPAGALRRARHRGPDGGSRRLPHT
jgi:hypothetical protein